MYAGTSNTDKDPQIPARPSWICHRKLLDLKSEERQNWVMSLTLIPFAVCTRLVPFQFQQTLDCLCVLRSALCSRIDWPS
jgi:hypothetical protein